MFVDRTVSLESETRELLEFAETLCRFLAGAFFVVGGSFCAERDGEMISAEERASDILVLIGCTAFDDDGGVGSAVSNSNDP